MNLRPLRRLLAFIRRSPLEERLEVELASHLDLATEDYIRRGMPPEEARRAAFLSLGGLQQARERQREARGLMPVDILLQDVKYTMRTLRRDRGFAAVAISILALAIGANTAVFSVVNSLMLRPLPFPDAQQLVWIAPPAQKCGLSCATYSTDAYDEFRMYTRSYQDVTGYFAFSSPGNLSLTRGGAPIPATSIDVIANFFQVLGVRAAMGRLFDAGDARHGAPRVIILSNPWWRSQFNADPAIVGKTFDINGAQTTVIGVLPARFDFGAVFAPGTKVDAFTPLDLYGPPRDWGNIVTMIGRLKPGLTPAQARDDAQTAAPHLCWNNKAPRTCGSYVRAGIVPVALKTYVSGRLHRSLIVLWFAVGAILLIACVNLSNLLLARASARSKEFAVRGALGASRSRIVRQLLTESLVLSGAGALLGVVLSFFTVHWLAHQGSLALPLLSTLQVDGASLAWTLLIAIVAALLFGLLPGLRMAGGDPSEALKDSGAGTGQSHKHQRVRSILVVTEVALAFALLAGAGLLLRSFLRVTDIDLGFQPERAAAVKVQYNDSAPNSDARSQKRRIIFQQILSRVEAIPGVEAAGISDYLPLGQNRSWGTPFPKGVAPPRTLPAGPLVYVVTPGYLRAMGTPLRGRDFTWDDGLKSEQVVIISQDFARFLSSYAHWPGGNAVGQILTDGRDNLRIIGVADDVHAESVEGQNGWQIYYSALQATPTGAELVVRTTLPPAVLATSVMRVLRDLNPAQPKAEFLPIQALVDHANSPRRFFMLLVAAFAALGLLLAALGIYGVISYSVTRKTQEIGIRMALGAGAGSVQRRVLGETLRLTMIGVMIGTAGSLAIARLIASLLFDTSPWDAVTYFGVAAAMVGVAALSGYLPARRASRIDPAAALRAN